MSSKKWSVHTFPAKRLTFRIISLFLLCVFPFILIAGFVTHEAQHLIYDNILSSYEYKTKLIREHFSDILNDILYQLTCVISDSQVIRYSSLQHGQVVSEFDELMMETQIRGQAKKLLFTNNSIRNVWICFPRSKTIMTASTENDSDMPLERLLLILSAFDFRYRKAPIVYYEGKIYVVAWSTDYLADINDSYPSIFACIELSPALLSSFFDNILEENEGFLAMYDENNNLFISTYDQCTTREDLSGISKNDYFSFSSYLSQYGVYIDYYVDSAGIMRPVRIIYLVLVLMIIVMAFVIAFFLMQLYRLLYQPLNILNSAFDAVSGRNFKLPEKSANESVFAEYYIILQDLLSKIKHSIQEIVDYKIALKEAQFKQFQSNINPHFLYNTLFSISCLCRSGNSIQAADMTEKLSQLFQFICKDSNEYTYLKTEVSFAKIYTDIQQMRFSTRVRVELDPLPKAVENWYIPRLVIQPFIENAYKYAFEECVEGGLLHIGFEQDGSDLHIIIEDNGNITDETLKTLQKQLTIHSVDSGAILNVKIRLQWFFGKGEFIRLERSPLGGLKVVLTISKVGFQLDNLSFNCDNT